MKPSPANRHRQRGAGIRARCAVLTVSDSRTTEDDKSGKLIRERLTAAGHVVEGRALEPDEPDRIRKRVESWLADGELHLVIVTGGTGVSPRDRTLEALRPLWQRELPGFGELFRWLSYQQVGAAAMLSRASAGIHESTAIFLLPGSPRAVELAMDELILPEIGHLLGLLSSSQ